MTRGEVSRDQPRRAVHTGDGSRAGRSGADDGQREEREVAVAEGRRVGPIADVRVRAL